jgi:hypothetical protein
MSHAVEENKYMNKYYSALKGAIITDTKMSEPEPGEDTDGWYESYPTLHATLQDGTEVILEISRDPEGNGPGFIFGLPVPLPDKD